MANEFVADPQEGKKVYDLDRAHVFIPGVPKVQ
jgi:hypothetical protein